MALEITDTNIGVALESEITVLDFWAQWCGPCRMVGPIIDELSDDNSSNEDITIGKVDVDSNPRLAATYGIRSIPAVIYFKNGEEVGRILGGNPKSVYQDKIDTLN